MGEEPQEIKSSEYIQEEGLKSVLHNSISNEMTSTCPTCSKASSSYIYAVGNIGIRYPSKGVEREFFHTSKNEEIKPSDKGIIYDLLRKNRYLTREVCWILQINDVDNYILSPVDPVELSNFIEPLKDADKVVIIGRKGPNSTPSTCGGLITPIVFVDKMYSFRIEDFIKQIPTTKDSDTKDFTQKCKDLFYRLTDNPGSTDEERAMNFLGIRSASIYSHNAAMYNQENFLDEIKVIPSLFFGTRRIYDIIFSYTNRKTSTTQRNFIRVDVTEKWPFLLGNLQDYS